MTCAHRDALVRADERLHEQEMRYAVLRADIEALSALITDIAEARRQYVHGNDLEHDTLINHEANALQRAADLFRLLVTNEDEFVRQMRIEVMGYAPSWTWGDLATKHDTLPIDPLLNMPD